MERQKLGAKNLITVGVFTAIYFVLVFATGMIGYIPVFMLLLPLLIPVVTGIPFMLFLTKVRVFGMVTLMGSIVGLIMFISGHLWPTLATAVACGLIGDLILRSGQYKGWKTTVIGYIVFSEWSIGSMIPLFFMRESYFAELRAGYGEAYTDALLKLLPNWIFYAMIAMVLVGSVIGAYVGRRVLKKHFKRAGIA